MGGRETSNSSIECFLPLLDGRGTRENGAYKSDRRKFHALPDYSEHWTIYTLRVKMCHMNKVTCVESQGKISVFREP